MVDKEPNGPSLVLMSSVSCSLRMAWVWWEHKGESARGLYNGQGAGGAQLYSKRLKCTPAHPPPPPRFTLYTRLPCALYPFSLLSLISCGMASGVQDLQLVVFEVKQCLAIKKITPTVVIYSYLRTKPFMNKNTSTILSWMERLTETQDREDWLDQEYHKGLISDHKLHQNTCLMYTIQSSIINPFSFDTWSENASSTNWTTGSLQMMGMNKLAYVKISLGF